MMTHLVVGSSLKAVLAALFVLEESALCTLWGDVQEIEDAVLPQDALCTRYQMAISSGRLKVVSDLSEVADVGLIWCFDVRFDLRTLPWDTPYILSQNISFEEAHLALGAWVNAVYVPFVFLVSACPWQDILAPRFLLIGQTDSDNALPCPIECLKSRAKAHHTSDVKTIIFARLGLHAMLSARLSLINELSGLADNMSVDIDEISRILSLDRRIGGDYLKAGWGFGGATLSEDLDVLVSYFDALSNQGKVPRAILQANCDQKKRVFEKIWHHFQGDLTKRVILIVGAAYREGVPNTDGSVIYELVPMLTSAGALCLVHAPHLNGVLMRTLGDEIRIHNAPTIDKEVSAIVLVEHPSHALWEQMQRVNVPIFDAKNTLTNRQINALAASYIGMGKSKL